MHVQQAERLSDNVGIDHLVLVSALMCFAHHVYADEPTRVGVKEPWFHNSLKAFDHRLQQSSVSGMPLRAPRLRDADEERGPSVAALLLLLRQLGLNHLAGGLVVRPARFLAGCGTVAD